MKSFQIQLLAPSECSANDLKIFEALVLKGGQVDPIGLNARIASAYLLGFARIDEKVVGIASIKRPARSYITGRFLKAKVPNQAINFQYEVGYAVTDEGFRRRGISQELLSELIKSQPDHKFYATTKDDGMRVLLQKSGFKKTGNDYSNDAGEVLTLFTR